MQLYHRVWINASQENEELEINAFFKKCQERINNFNLYNLQYFNNIFKM